MLGQSPAPGTAIANGATITLMTARPPLPDMICLNVEEARALLERTAEGRVLRWQETSQPSSLPEGLVIGQTPLPGTPLPAIGEELRARITVSIGRQTTRTPTISRLEAVHGIGPIRARRLRAAGIENVNALATAEATEVAEALRIRESLARTLIERARSLLRGQATT